jgi:hypothetical protein
VTIRAKLYLAIALTVLGPLATIAVAQRLADGLGLRRRRLTPDLREFRSRFPARPPRGQ